MAAQAVESRCPLSVTETLTYTPCATDLGGSISYCPETSQYASTTTTLVYGTPCSAPTTVVVPTTIEPPGTTTATIYVPTFTPPTTPTVTVTTTSAPPPVTVITTSTQPCTTCITTDSTTPTSSWPTTQHPTPTPPGSCESYAGVQTWGNCQYYVFCDFFLGGTVIYSTYADSMQQCLQSCNLIDECNFASWAPYPVAGPGGSPADNCFLRVDANVTTQGPDVWGAQKLYCPGDTTTAQPTTPWATTSPPTTSTSTPPDTTSTPPQTTSTPPETISTPSETSTPATTSTPPATSCPQSLCSPTSTSTTISTITYTPPPPPTTTGPLGSAPTTLTSIVTTWSTTGTTTSTVSVTITPTPRATRNNAPRFRLRTHVTLGKRDPFNNLYIQVPANMFVPSYPLLSSNKSAAAPFYYDTSTSSIDMCCTYRDGLSGLTMFQDNDMNELGPVFLQNAVGTARMFFRNGELLWANDRFGSWVACMVPIRGDDPANSQYKYQLMWWDVITNMGIDTNWCAKVQLLPEKATWDSC